MPTVIPTPNKFTAPLTVTQLDGDDLWITDREFAYYVDDARTEIITVPAGFKTDFASKPV